MGRKVKARTCGSCTACCTQLRIDSLPGFSTRIDNGEDVAKPAGVPCRFLSEKGCGIYTVRPPVCRHFACDWLLGRAGYREADFPPEVGAIGVRGHAYPFCE